jgi:hypothetical protein
MPRWLLKPLSVALVVALFLGGLMALGKIAWQQVREQERYTVALADIDCTPPPGQGRADFLDEVQYLGGLPSRFSLLEDGLSERLARAFARHPRVEEVEQVVLQAPRQVHVRLRYRVPVLAVRWEGRLWAVDGEGVWLPKETPTQGLPVFAKPAAPPQGSAGSRWGDPAVEAAARQLAR